VGTTRRGPGVRLAPRSIPTCVGTTTPPGHLQRICTVHPHVRGDYPHPAVEGQNLRRSIPTCVGTTPGGPLAATHRAVHPHVRGDYAEGGPTGGDGSGSAVHPHVRGDYGFDVIYVGFGPSPRAWGLHRLINIASSPTVHPHVRGDYCIEGPRKPRIGHRSIPTCVGTTRAYLGGARGTPSIPTCVGTTWAPPQERSPSAGPSPRAWGLRERFPPLGQPLIGLPVHPHVRGDYSISSRKGGGKWAESSVHPHVRGDYT